MHTTKSKEVLGACCNLLGLGTYHPIKPTQERWQLARRMPYIKEWHIWVGEFEPQKLYAVVIATSFVYVAIDCIIKS